MANDLQQWLPHTGMDVVGSDGDKVGEVDAVERDYFVVRKGFFFPEDHYVPLNAVDNHDDQTIYLNVTKEQALEQEWTAPPVAGYDSPRHDLDTNREDDLAQVDTTSRPGTAGTNRNLPDDDHTERDSATIPVHEEELIAKRRQVDRGEVRVQKDVVSEEQEIDVPVTEERVNVSRRDVNREVTPGEHVFEEDTVDIPVHGEQVDVEKRARVTGEVDIEKTAEHRTEHVRDTVRHEEVSIQGEEVGGDTKNTRRGKNGKKK